MLRLVSFADGPYSRRASVFQHEAKALGVFDEIVVHDRATLDPNYRQHHERYMLANERGFGHYIWKSQVVHQACTDASEHDLICWLDIGFTLNPMGQPRFREYIRLAYESPWSMLSFWSVHTENRWTKADLAVRLGVSDNIAVMGTSQLSSGFFLFRPTADNVRLIRTWAELATEHDYHYSSDAPSVVADHPRFVAHRHDQSIFSLLRKIRGTTSTCYEVQPYADWFQRFRADFPCWATRLRE